MVRRPASYPTARVGQWKEDLYDFDSGWIRSARNHHHSGRRGRELRRWGMFRVATGLLLVVCVSTYARAACSKPDAPYCASGYGRFDDEYSFSSCKSEMESYRSEVEDFLACQRREGQAAIDEYN